jgi:hypothetical protein
VAADGLAVGALDLAGAIERMAKIIPRIFRIMEIAR